MKLIGVVLTGILFLIGLSGCEKCFTCRNFCQVCRETHSLGVTDTTLTIIVRSNTLSEKYYLEYLDSLTSPSLGWTCKDTASDYTERFCQSSVANQYEIVSRKESGMYCSAE